MFCITGWIGPEPSHPFSTPNDNWALTWFVAHISRYDTRLLIFWKKNAFVKISCRNQKGIPMFLTLGVTILASITEIQLV